MRRCQEKSCDVLLLIVPGFFTTKDVKIDHLNGIKIFVVELFQVQEKGDLELAAFIVEHLCGDLTFEVGINFFIQFVYLQITVLSDWHIPKSC